MPMECRRKCRTSLRRTTRTPKLSVPYPQRIRSSTCRSRQQGLCRRSPTTDSPPMPASHSAAARAIAMVNEVGIPRFFRKVPVKLGGTKASGHVCHSQGCPIGRGADDLPQKPPRIQDAPLESVRPPHVSRGCSSHRGVQVRGSVLRMRISDR